MRSSIICAKKIYLYNIIRQAKTRKRSIRGKYSNFEPSEEMKNNENEGDILKKLKVVKATRNCVGDPCQRRIFNFTQ